MAANTPPLTKYGTTTTTFLTTTISVSSNQPSFTILYPPPGTEELNITIFSAISNPSISSTYTPFPLPILVLTNVVGIAINPSGSPVATRTLSQPPPPQATNTNNTTPTSSPAATCDIWSCWSKEKKIGVFLGAGLGALLILVLLWWIFFWRRRIKRISFRRTGPGDVEGGEEGIPPLKIGIRTSMSQTRSKNKGKGRREESLTPTPPPGGRIVDGDIRVVPGSGGRKGPVAYKVVRQPSVREFVGRVSMPDGVGDVRSRDFAVPVVGAAEGGSVRSASRAGRGSRNEGDVRVSRGESMREKEDHGSRRARRDEERSERWRDRETEDRISDERRRSQSPRGREEDGDARHGGRRRYREEGDGASRIRRHSYAPRDEEGFEVRRDRSPRRRHSGRDEEKRRTRSVSPKRRDRYREKQRKRRDSESGIGSGLKKLLPLLPLVFGLMSTYGEPKGGWDQYIPEEKRKGKEKLKKMAEDAFDKHHHKIPEDFPRHLHSHSPRSKSADRAYTSTRPPRSPSPPRKQERTSHRNRNRDRRASVRPVGNMREGFNSITPEQGSAITTLTPSPPPRRRRSNRERRFGGYDGADDEDFVVYSAETQEGSVEEVTLPYEISEPDSPVLRGARTFPLSSGFEERGKDGYREFMPPTPPSTIY